MFTRLLLALLLMVTFVAPSSAQGKGLGGSSGQRAGAAVSSQSDGGSEGAPSRNGDAHGPPDRAADDSHQSNHNSNYGGATSSGNDSAADAENRGGGGKAHGGGNRLSGAVPLNTDEALALVQTHQAMPLSELSEIVHQRSGAEMVDAELLKVGQILVYAIKVIDQAERLSVQYYYARSGRYIGSE